MAIFETITMAAFFVFTACALAQEGCPNTGTSCQCSKNEPADVCFLPVGNGTCLTGPCNEGYKCDCNGYELCSVAECDSYSMDSVSQPSTEMMFPCKLNPGKGVCISQVGVMNTVRSSYLAVKEANMNHAKIMNSSKYISKYVHELQNLYKNMSYELQGIRMKWENVSDEKRESIREYVQIVESSISGMVYMLVGMVETVHSTGLMVQSVYNYFGIASSALDMKKKRDAQLMEEKKKPLMDSKLVIRLEKESKEFKKMKQENSIFCNKEAINIRFYARDILLEMERATVMRTSAQEAAVLSLEKAKKAMGMRMESPNKTESSYSSTGCE